MTILKNMILFFLYVFDTAILRLFLKPVDLFKYIEFVTNYHGFHDLRMASEIKARKLSSRRKDINIVEIYKSLPFGKIETEIQAELKFCVTNPEIFSLYSRAIAENKKVYFVSDIYLDKETIANILEKSEYSIYEEIFVSSEDDLIKGDGSRFQWLKTAIPESVGTAIHIGDNPVADFYQPKNHGFDAIRYIDNISYFRCDDFLFSKIDFLQSKNSLGLSFVIANFRYWKSRFKESPTYWRQFGFLYGGALVVAFCNFINNYLFKNNISCKKYFSCT
jgi:Predicted hydrolase (HAD superfamily)